MSTDLIKHTTTSTVLIDDVEIPVEFANDPVEGLSGRDDLAVNTGMLFDLDGHPVITMRGMKFSLDIIWIGEDKKVVDISRNTLVSVLGNDTLYTPEKPAQYALEINAGEAQKRGIKVGNEVEINLLPNSDLTRLLVLEEVLDYLAKAVPGEKLEYLKPGEKAPRGIQVQRGARGGRGYYPSEVTAVEEETAVLEPTEEREIDVVAPPEPEEQPDMLIPNVVNEYFDTVATNLENQLIKVVGEGHQPFLGNEVLPSKLTADNITKAGYTDGSKEGVGYPSGLGINSYENFTVTIGTGFLGRQKSQFIYKMVPGENRGEILAYSIDRTLGLNIVPFVKQHSIDVFTLSDQLEQAHGDPIQDYSLQEMREKGVDTRAAGHFQEFCDNCVGRDEQPKIMAEMMSTEKGREEFFKIMLLDYITGNSDRHTGNYLITEDGKIVAIDNGMIAGTRKPHSEQASLNLDPNTFGWLSFPYGLSEEMDKIQDIETLTTDDLQDEAANFFDKHFNQDKLDAVLATVNWKAFPQYNHSETIFKDNFVKRAANNMGAAFDAGGEYSLGQSGILFDNSFGDSPDGFGFAPSSSEVKRELAAEGINVKVIHSLGFDGNPMIGESEPNIYEEDEFN